MYQPLRRSPVVMKADCDIWFANLISPCLAHRNVFLGSPIIYSLLPVVSYFKANIKMATSMKKVARQRWDSVIRITFAGRPHSADRPTYALASRRLHCLLQRIVSHSLDEVVPLDGIPI